MQRGFGVRLDGGRRTRPGVRAYRPPMPIPRFGRAAMARADTP